MKLQKSICLCLGLWFWLGCGGHRLPLKNPVSIGVMPFESGSMSREAGELNQKLFASLQCDQCHGEPTYTSVDVYDVQLHDSQGQREFNPPSLLGVSHRQRLFHDNRATGLAQVFTEFAHGLDEPLAEGDLQALLAFLSSL